MRRQIVLGIILSSILIFGIAAGALAQEATFSAKVLTKGSRSNILILVKNSSKNTASIYEFKVTFTQGKPITAIARGDWEKQKDSNTVTFITKRSPIKPGGTETFLIKVSDPAGSAFEWTMKDKNGAELQSGEVAKIKVREKKSIPEGPKITKPEITVNQARVSQNGQVIVTGKRFSASSTVQLFLDDQQQLTTSTTNPAGEFSAVVIIPSQAAPGAHKITAKDAFGKSSLIEILVELAAGQTAPYQGQLILTVKTDKTEYSPGDTIKITGTAVLSIAVSLQISDPQGGIICGSNPPVNNATMTWETVCFLPSNAPGGVYVVQAKQIVHKTGVRFTVIGKTIGGTPGHPGPGAAGEDPGTLKLSTDKQSYKSGATVEITLQGARAKSVVQIIILGPSGPPLDAAQISTDDSGSVTYSFHLVGAAVGTYKVSGKQNAQGTPGKYFIVRTTFEVTT